MKISTLRVLHVATDALLVSAGWLAAWGIRPPSRGIVRPGMVGEPRQGAPPAEGEFA